MGIREDFLRLLDRQRQQVVRDPYYNKTPEQGCYEFGSSDGCHLDCPVFLLGECEVPHDVIQQGFDDGELAEDISLEDAIDTYDYFVMAIHLDGE